VPRTRNDFSDSINRDPGNTAGRVCKFGLVGIAEKNGKKNSPDILVSEHFLTKREISFIQLQQKFARCHYPWKIPRALRDRARVKLQHGIGNSHDSPAKSAAAALQADVP
jgi:hypothetical protein